MRWDFDQIRHEAGQDFSGISDLDALEAARIKYLGRKGLLTDIFAGLATASKEDKPALGREANALRTWLAREIEAKRAALAEGLDQQKGVDIDVSLPGVAPAPGHKHVLAQTVAEICQLFVGLGFVVQDGPEVETEFHNFTALNIPVDHPSRDAFDTFYLDTKDPARAGRHFLLRSHTSPGQIRIMEKHKPPLAVVVPGKVYRPDAVDASHSFMFHQIEGLLVAEQVRFSDLKGLLTVFCQRLFGEQINMRFRPHFFPFTEPSAEVDISCYICRGKGCSVCGRKGWLEIMGCGMVNPKVFEAAGYPKGKYSGLAFGMGVERMAMLKHSIHDIRIFFENDIRFLKQF